MSNVYEGALHPIPRRLLAESKNRFELLLNELEVPFAYATFPEVVGEILKVIP